MAFLEPLIAAVAEGGAAAGAGEAAAGAAGGEAAAGSSMGGILKNLAGGQFGGVNPHQGGPPMTGSPMDIGKGLKWATTGYQLQADDG